MTTLTAAEIADIRLVTGAANTTVLSDTVIQAQYDQATADSPESSLTLPYTYVYILRRLWGFQRIRQDRNTAHGDRQTRSQIDDSTKDLLDYWEGVAGLSGGGILLSGAVDLGLDEDEVTA